MDALLISFFRALPFLVVAAIVLLLVLGIGIGAVWPQLLVYPYLAVFFLVNSSGYASMQVAGPGIYSRGSGLLYFPLIMWYMFGALCCAKVNAAFAGLARPECNLRPWFWAWAALLAGHVAVALSSGVKLSGALSPSGFSNIVWMAPLVALMLLTFRTESALVRLGRLVLLLGLARALFGLVRWAGFGGDPNNVYANFNAVDIRLTFFDINDSLVCLIAFAIAAVDLFHAARMRSSPFWRAIEWATLVSTAACIVLSYRRIAWAGFVLAFLVVAMQFPARRRLQLMLAGLPALALALAYVAIARLSQTKGAGGLQGFFYDIESRRLGAESQRLLELQLALADFLANPLTGIGAWGSYTGFQRISWQLGPGGGQFIHSGVLHIALKSGLIGLALFAGLAYAFVAFSRRALAEMPPALLGLGTAGVAGIAFMVPDMLIGTPFPQVRTTQMMAICLAFPYLAMNAARAGARLGAGAA